MMGDTKLGDRLDVYADVRVAAKPGSQSERAVSADLLSYYEQVTRAILSSDDQLMMVRGGAGQAERYRLGENQHPTAR